MELVFLAILILLMASALASGFPVAFALPGSAILSIGLAALSGWIFAGDPSAYFAQGGPVQWLTAGVTNFRGIYWEVERDTLIAIPLFVFMGIMLQRSKIAEDLLVTMAQLFGPVRGGLGVSVVFVGGLLAATTGIVGATVVAMGLISLPAMLRSNYSKSLATGTIAASGTLGQIIPPSIVLIILADQLASAVDQAGTARKTLYRETTGSFSMPSEFGVTSTSAGDMFLGALIPGLILVGLYMVFILALAIVRRKVAPAVALEGELDRRFMMRVFVILIPPLTLIFIVLGSIILGIATVNQAGAIGAVGAMIMAGYRLKEGQKDAFYPALLAILCVVALFFISHTFSTNIRNIKTAEDAMGVSLAALASIGLIIATVWSGWRTFKIDNTLRGVILETAKTTSLVFIILLGAAMLTAAFRSFGGEELVKNFLTSLPGGFWMQFVIVMAVIFVLGFFLDFIEIAVVVVPIVAPILLMDPSANITAVWLGVMIGLNIQTSFLTPPFGFALFYLRGVAPPSVRTVDMYKGVVPFISLQLLALVIVGSWPPLVNYLPNRISLLSDTAPPPLNPRLQSCIEQDLFQQYAANEQSLRNSINEVRSLNTGFLPKKFQSDLRDGLDKAKSIFELIDKVKSTGRIMDAAAVEYRPVHQEVRRIQRDIGRLKSEINESRNQINRIKRTPDADQSQIEILGSQLAALQAEQKVLEASIPSDWGEVSKKFKSLQNTHKIARRQYQQAADSAYEPVRELIEVIEAFPALQEVEAELKQITQAISSNNLDDISVKINDATKLVRRIPGTSTLSSKLSSARRFTRGRRSDPEQVKENMEQGLKLVADDLAWRKQASEEILDGLRAYELTIRNNIGLRQQARLPRDKAIAVASCSSVHQDLSLSF